MSKKGVGLVELLVVMALIAILIAAGAYGNTIIQRVGRENERLSLMSKMKIEIQQYRLDNGTFPNDATTPSLLSFNNVAKTVIVDNRAIDAKASYLAPSTNSTSNSTQYCYFLATDGFVLAYKTELGTWSNHGTSSTSCTNANAVSPF